METLSRLFGVSYLFLNRGLVPQCGSAERPVPDWGLWAKIQRALGRLDWAEESLKIAFDHVKSCGACLAELHRRRSFVRRDREDFSGALEDAAEAIRRYIEMGQPGHDLYGNGLASSYFAQATILFETSDFSGAVAGFRRALMLTEPTVSPVLYRLILTNLAATLQATGRQSDLLEADQILRKARRKFKGVRKCSEERAKLNWITALVRYQLGREKPYRIRKMFLRALADFLELGGFPQECVAIVADMARVEWPHGDSRARIRSLMEEMDGRLPLAEISPDIRAALNQVSRANELCGFNAHDALKETIEALREICGPKMIPCLITR